MGGLRHRMPRTFWTYMVGALALIGIFPLAGFWSKDEILTEAFNLWQTSGTLGLPFWAWVIGTFNVLLSALYMGRQIALVFWGQPRHAAASEARESPNSMTWPLIILAVFAVIGGFANVPFLGRPLHQLMGEVHAASQAVHLAIVPFSFFVSGLALVLGVVGLLVGWGVYRNYQAGEVEPFQRWLGPVFTLLKNKYYVDEFYHLVIIRPVLWLSDQAFNFDNRWVLDPIVNLVGAAGRVAADISQVLDATVVDSTLVEGTAKAFNAAGGWLRQIQTGRAQNYLLVVAVTVLMLLGLYLYL
jgi:NADH-quinone oxidoreductase subunit L